jgi:hypothetical protein
MAMPVAGRASKFGLSAEFFHSVCTLPGHGRRERPERPAAVRLLMHPVHLDEFLLTSALHNGTVLHNRAQVCTTNPTVVWHGRSMSASPLPNFYGDAHTISCKAKSSL